MKHRHLPVVLPVVLAATLALGACSKGTEPAATNDKSGEPVAVVNGKPISKSTFDLYVDNIARQSGQEVADQHRDELLDRFIGMVLAAEAAEKGGIAKDGSVRDQLEYARINVVADAGLKKYLDEHPVVDADLKPEYDAQVAQMPREYHARHILVDDKAVADQITKDLQGGADFAKLAKSKSKDSSKEQGGDLGWFTLDSMVKPFSDAVKALQPGQLTAAPVQSEYGWHVIRLEESRATAPPAFDEVKDRVRAFVQRKKLQTYLDDLRKGAKVEKTAAAAAPAAPAVPTTGAPAVPTTGAPEAPKQ